MEWVETTGRTVEEAKEAALDRLGVDEPDAEFEVLEEPRPGLFGRLRSAARVRARVRPATPRTKDDRRDRRRRPRSASSDEPSGTSSTNPTRARQGGSNLATLDQESDAGEPGDAANADDRPAARTGPGGSPGRRRRRRRGAGGAVASESGVGGERKSSGTGRASGPGSTGTLGELRDAGAGHDRGGSQVQVEVPLDDQAGVAREFLTGLLAELGLDARLAVDRPDEETVEIGLSGSNLGLLIGPRGTTLLAIQELTRTVVHRKTGATNGRIRVDVGGYRRKRADALTRFALQVAADVKQSGTPTALEPMAAPDRKIVHDAVSSLEGVSTISEGVEPRRRVVILPGEA